MDWKWNVLCTEIYVEHSPEVSPRRVYVDCYRAAEIDMKTFKVNIAGVLSLSSLQFTCVFVVDLLFKALQENDLFAYCSVGTVRPDNVLSVLTEYDSDALHHSNRPIRHLQRKPIEANKLRLIGLQSNYGEQTLKSYANCRACCRPT